MSVNIAEFIAALRDPATLAIAPGAADRLARDREAVVVAAAGDAPVYGLNTGLGGNLAHRLDAAGIGAFQHLIIAGRNVATGPALDRETGLAWILARIISASGGGSGISVPVFEHLVACICTGLAPAIPSWGSIGAGDLTQNAAAAAALWGNGRIWSADGQRVDAAEALAGLGLAPPVLLPKDGMALINHSALSVARGALGLDAAGRALCAARATAILSCEGYGSNPAIFAPDINALRPAPGQAEMAAWFHRHLAGADIAPRRIQEAISFRTLAPVLGAAFDAHARCCAIWQAEANGLSDSPAVMADGRMVSTPNFHNPAFGFALDALALALAMVGQGAAMRLQRLMDPDLSGLPKYLSPVGGASAGFVPAQKTAMALLAEVRRAAAPAALDPPPVSDTVEDMAPMVPQAAGRLADQARALVQLIAIEALVAAQALDLRAPKAVSGISARLHADLRALSPRLEGDRALGPEFDRVANWLADPARVWAD